MLVRMQFGSSLRLSARVRRGLYTGLAAMGAAGLVGLVGDGAFEETFGLAALYRMRGALPAPEHVAIVAMDRSSAVKLGIPPPPQLWSRGLHAKLVGELTRRGAQTIVFDVVFVTDDGSEGSAALAEAVRSAGNVVLLSGAEQYGGAPSGSGTTPVVDERTLPARAFAAGALAAAPFPVPKVPARLEQFWAFWGESSQPTLPAVTLQASARGTLPEWVKLLSDADALESTEADWRPPMVTATMAKLHRRAKADEALAERLEANLDALPKVTRKRLAPLVALYTGEDVRVLDFHGPPGTIRTLDYAALVAGGDARPGSLAGDIVFVGADERENTRQPDAYNTVFSDRRGLQLSGVEILATAYANLAGDSAIRAPSWIDLLVVAAVAAGIGAAAAWSGIAAILGAAGLVVANLGIGYGAFALHHIAIPVATPITIEIPLGLLVAGWLLRREEQALRQRIDGAIRQFLPDDLARSLADGPLAPSAMPVRSARFAACLATDIMGYTSLSERLGYEQMPALLDDYFRPLFEITARHGGTIFGVAGDGMMCAWRSEREESAQRAACASALAAALEMAEAVDRFNGEHQETRLPTRFGLHAGPVIIGAVGGAGHYVSTVVGDVANTASRIENLNKRFGTQLLASLPTVPDTAAVVTRPLGAFLLRGKSEPVEVVEVIARGDAAAAFAGEFAVAIGHLREGRWNEAIASLTLLHRRYPADVPTSYFLERVRRLAERNEPDVLMTRMEET